MLMLHNSEDSLYVVQLGFFNIVGIPLFKAMADLFEDSQPMLDGVLANFRQWQDMAEGVAAPGAPDAPA